ncbi:structural maintenance of chromosomes protein 5-like [Liolophura sinensis]|uniref:structural maintenance of chromosomes protein 5-like n=1 Tax=Liolophura sinensis TaxID=3198878 RepID=UPI003158EB70
MTAAGDNAADYVEGSILRVKLENVLTYDSVEFQCGPYLNVIIGPNGTGKSTIVCAICLGLGGKTSFLGRAHQPSDYIKYGNDKAKIELELFNPDGENYIIQRQIFKNNTSNWMVNGRGAAHRTVEETVSRLNIQLGNLCQFLPQEKVADFAKMTQQELLENTEKAVGTPEMYENHQKLKHTRNDSRNLELGYNNLFQRVEQEVQKNSHLEHEVKNYEERQRHLEKIKLLEMKKPWVEYEEQRRHYQAEKLKKDAMSEELRKAQREFRPLKQKLEEAESKVKKLHNEMVKLVDKVKGHATQAHEKSNQIEAESDKVLEVYEELKFRQQEEVTRKKLLHDLRRQLGALENELASSSHGEDIQPAIDKVNQEARAINASLTHNQQAANTIQGEVESGRQEMYGYQRELQQLQNVSNRRLELLRQCHRHTYEAVIWLRANKHRFKATIHEPMILTVNVKDASDAKYIESHVSFNDIRAFVCEESEDLNLFMDVMRDEQKLKVNAISMPSQPLSSFKPAFRLEDFRKYGFRCYLKDMIECPEAIMRYLCLQYHVHSIMIGTEKTKAMVERVIQENPRLTSFYTANNQYAIRRSKYDGELARRNTQLKKPSLLTVALDNQRIARLQQSIQDCQTTLQAAEQKYSKLQQDSRELDTRLNQLRNEKKELSKQKDRKRTLLSQIETKKQSISRKEKEGLDMEGEKRKAADKIRQITVKKCQHLQVLKDQTKHCFELGMARVRLSLAHALAKKETTDIETLISDQSQSLQNLERANIEMKERLRQTKDRAKQLLDIAKQATGTSNSEELSSELKQAFEALPRTVDEIDSCIHEQRVRADCKFQTDERIVKEFNTRKRDIAQMQRELANKKDALERHQTVMEKAKQEWLTPLKSLVNRISQNFSLFFQSLHCSGEVDLSVPENPEDYEKYGIRIKVKYRDTEPLRELTPFHQSGGERSVATVLYMMALQELTNCPFRCVDEINQGMDPINERKVFELVVHTVCKRSSSQYFLLTPKLLPDLEYSDNMRVLCVYNGPLMMNHTEWRLKKFIHRRQRLTEEVG